MKSLWTIISRAIATTWDCVVFETSFVFMQKMMMMIGFVLRWVGEKCMSKGNAKKIYHNSLVHTYAYQFY